MRRFIAALIAIGLAAVLPAAGGGASADADDCDDRIGGDAFVDADTLAEWNRVMSDLGPRPTGSEAHHEFVSWLEARLHEVPELEVTADAYPIDQRLETGASLTLEGVDVPVAGPVPYSEQTTASGDLVHIPPETPLADVPAGDIAGKVILRDVVPGIIQMPIFLAVAYYVHDPALSFDWTGNYERDWASAVQRIDDIHAATEKGAAGLVFAHPFPREQMAGDYHPYEGLFYELPMVYVGVDEAEELKAAEGSTVEVSVEGTETLGVETRNVIATLPGDPSSELSHERINIASHTDGMNAIWDNGPIAILGLAKYFASLPVHCRPRPIQFAFTTAHLHLEEVGAERLAGQLDEDYDNVAFAVALEHLGAEEFVAVPRNGAPGERLEASGQSELFAIFVHESPVTLQAVTRAVIDRDLRRSFILRGADAPDVRFPPHQSYGGEGGPYHNELIPTVAAITGPTTLFKPAFGQDELLDPELMRRQTMAFGDVVLELDDVPKAVIAGADTAYRIGRDLTAGEE